MPQTVSELRTREAQLAATVRDHKRAMERHRRMLRETAVELDRVRFALQQQLDQQSGAGVIHGQADSRSR